MRKMLSWAAVAAFLAVPGAVCGQQGAGTAGSQGQAQTTAQASTTVSSGTQQESLAEAARKAREAKKEQPAKAAKVFDNDNLPTTGGVSTAKAEVKEGEAGATDQTASGEKKGSPQDEKAWREKFAGLRAKLARDQQDLEVMQRELGVLNVQNYGDPMKDMQQQLTRGDINKKTADIDAKQKQIQADQQAIADAEDQLRKAGGDSGWAR